MCHGVEGHIDGGIRQRFDKINRVPGKESAKAVGTGTRPLIQPIEDNFEAPAHLRGEIHATKKLGGFLFPFLFSILYVPLVG